MSSRPDASAFANDIYQRARRKAFLRGVLSALQGHSNELLPYDEVRHKVRAGMPNYRGMTSVPLDKIVGSVNRYRDFDRAFLPTQSETSARWRRIGEAYYSDINLPPVTLYKVGEVYFVVDGNHRVSVARELGREFIDAEVQECRVRVPLTPDMDPDDIEVIGEKANFLETTRLDEARPGMSIELTIPGGYHLLLEHIEYHRYMQSQEWKREFSTEEAAVHWYDKVYLPVVKVIRQSGVLNEFPGRTEGDLYIWIIEHQYFLREHLGPDVSTEEAARSFTEHFSPSRLKRFWHWITHHLLRRKTIEEELQERRAEQAEGR
ncbi:MAG TPA: DUF4032 domain-containing protein [Aggregatilineales bacterium]|nr:DUF4032 domain-containing protein [Aggregatilineales bacterium]HPV07850.1 DUF4032 domain-containing protein [Aggregatilineales bacterium]HQA68059.1 DUF4032 domain-containing protein [Aggregatilineales bacterium]HQE19935.1 DUF4032 domain-containing protein [Aggregatilineales bacterium]